MMNAKEFLTSQPRGTRAKIARATGLAVSNVTQWKHIPPRHAMAVAEITGVPVHILRPDIFPSPSRELECPASDAAGQPV
jgi:DNA-binding transcriptional regulator YdaS (Cro superfamily)